MNEDISRHRENIRQQIRALVGEYSALSAGTDSFVPGTTPVPPSGKLLDATELQYMMEAVLDGWLTTGRFNDAFEKSLARFIGTRSVLTTNSGSSANLIAISSLSSSRLGDKAIKPGDEIITVAAGFPTTVNPILQIGAIPVFIDISLPTYNVDVSQLEVALTEKTRAVVLAHTLGNPFDLEKITAFCKKHDLWLVEDCCDALGSLYHGKHVGTFGDIATLSFYPAHHITTGEGGAVFTSNPRLRQIAESIRDWGRDCFCPPGKDNSCGKRYDWQLGGLPQGYDHKYTYSHLGYNLKMTDMQAACGLAQMEKLPDFIAKRKAHFRYLHEQLQPLHHLLHLPEATANSEPSWFGYPVTLKKQAGIDRLSVLRQLEQHGIGTRLLFGGNLTRQPYMQHQHFRISGVLATTDQVMEHAFWIGVQPALTDEMLEYSVDVLNEILHPYLMGL